MKVCNNCKHLRKQKKPHFYICSNSKSKRFKVPFPHGKTRKACDQYKSKYPPPVKYDPEENFIQSKYLIQKGVKLIENYRHVFAGEDVWIIGCGPNQDYYPDDFFDNKHTIALNWSCVAWPKSDYFVIDPIGISKKMEKLPSSYQTNCNKKLVITTARDPAPWDSFGLDPLYMRNRPDKHQFSYIKEDFEKMAEQLFTGQPCQFLAGITQACAGTEVAAALGAKRIILIACWMLMGDAQKRGLSEFYANIREGFSKEYEIGQHPHQIRGRESIVRFATVFKKYGVEVIKHRFNVEEGKFEFVKVKSETGDLWNTSWGH